MTQESKLQWLLANLCAKHADINTCSSGPCAMCEAAGLREETCAHSMFHKGCYACAMRDREAFGKNAAGLREEIERLKRQLSSALTGEDDALRACREKGK